MSHISSTSFTYDGADVYHHVTGQYRAFHVTARNHPHPVAIQRRGDHLVWHVPPRKAGGPSPVLPLPQAYRHHCECLPLPAHHPHPHQRLPEQTQCWYVH